MTSNNDIDDQRLHDLFSVLFGSTFGSKKPLDSCHIYAEGRHTCSAGFVYIARSGDLYKVGYSSLVRGASTLSGRIDWIAKHLGIPFVFEHGLWANCGRGLEQYLHRRYAKLLFRVAYQAGANSESKEIFRLASEDFVFIQTMKSFNGNEVSHFENLDAVQRFYDLQIAI